MEFKQRQLNRKIIAWSVFAVLLLGVGLFLGWPKPMQTYLEINEQKIRVEVVDTDETRNKGLGGRRSLADDEGMLFVFDKSDHYIFWMKDMLIPIDIIYIENNKIVELVKNMLPPPAGVSPAVYQPFNKADMVLEVNAGLAEKYGWEIGSSVEITNYELKIKDYAEMTIESGLIGIMTVCAGRINWLHSKGCRGLAD